MSGETDPDVDQLGTFLVSGWDVDMSDIDKSRNPSDELQRTVLNAAENGHLDVLKDLLDKDPTLVHTVDKDKYTPLHRACYGNHLDVVKFLIEKGADLTAKTEMQWEPLHSCCQWNHVQCAAYLIVSGANVNATTEGGQTPLHIAATHGLDYATVELLLIHPYVNPHLKNNNGETAFDIARRSSKYYNIFDMVDPLLDIKNIELILSKETLPDI
ncbi:ankyrin repeat domain-containing protein 49-like [Euwallacea similis]|uniref:ankyrin repeat domain-containing protein 49-like n=1 Tax=Euwallacea similis TaxID=1736056 RepID=UPI00344E7612